MALVRLFPCHIGMIRECFVYRSAKLLPKHGDKSPWMGGVNYIVDMISLAVGGLKTDSLEFTKINKKRG